MNARIVDFIAVTEPYEAEKLSSYVNFAHIGACTRGKVA